MNITGLSSLKGTLNENLTPIITLLDNNRLQLSAVAMSKLGLSEKSRVEVGFDVDTRMFYIAALPEGSELGRSISKTGLFQHPTIWSGLADAAGSDSKWEVTDLVTPDGELNWNQLSVFVESTPTDVPVAEDVKADAEPVSSEGLANDVSEEPVAETEAATEEEPQGDVPAVESREGIVEIPEEEY